MTVSEFNHDNRPQICKHSKNGWLLRGKGDQYFYNVKKDIARHIDMHKQKYSEVEEIDLPNHLIRLTDRKIRNEKLYCIDCGKQFKRKFLENGRCRGYDGCAAEYEIKQLRIENTIPVGGIGSNFYDARLITDPRK